MAAFTPPPKEDVSLADLAHGQAQLHNCLHLVSEAVTRLAAQANDRETNRQERHADMTRNLDSLTKWVENIDKRQDKMAAQFGVQDDAPQSNRRLFGLSRAALIGFIATFIIGFCTGPVGYYFWFKVIPAAIHGALTVAP